MTSPRTLDIRYPLCANEKRYAGQRSAMAVSRIAAWRVARARRAHPAARARRSTRSCAGCSKVYHEVTGLYAGYAFAIGGGTYSRMMPNTVAFGLNFPGDVDTCHMPDEYIDIDKHDADAVKIYRPRHRGPLAAAAKPDFPALPNCKGVFHLQPIFSIAIDGPAGAGKSTVAKALAERLNAMLSGHRRDVSRGRAVYSCGQSGLTEDTVAGRAHWPGYGHRRAGSERRYAAHAARRRGRERWRSARRRRSMAASRVSAVPEVRERLVRLQQRNRRAASPW